MVEETLMQALSSLFDQKITKFPGTLPVTIDADTQDELRHGFVPSLKANGLRVLCFIEQNKMRLMTRDKRTVALDLVHTFENDFVFDCEWHKEAKMLLIFDTLLFNNLVCRKADYLQRVRLACHFLCQIVPDAECRSFPKTVIQDPEPLPLGYDLSRCWKTSAFVVQVKPPYRGEDCAKLWHARHQLRYDCDGIIFTRQWCAYQPFSDPNVLSVMKWKPYSTVDFVLKPLTSKTRFVPKEVYHAQFDLFHHPNNESDCNVALLLQGASEEMYTFTFAQVADAILTLCVGQVCEFMWDDDRDVWLFQTLRHDKTQPNRVSTALSCLRSIAEKVRIEELADLLRVE